MDATQIVDSPGRASGRGQAGPRTLRRVLAVLDRVAPDLAALLIERLWFTPPRAPVSAAARAIPGGGEPLPLRIDGRRAAGWSFGAGRPVALMHGWGGNAGQLTAFISPLVDAGL